MPELPNTPVRLAPEDENRDDSEDDIQHDSGDEELFPPVDNRSISYSPIPSEDNGDEEIVSDVLAATSSQPDLPVIVADRSSQRPKRTRKQSISSSQTIAPPSKKSRGRGRKSTRK